MALFDFFRFSLLRRNFKELEILEIIFLSHIIISCLFWKNGNIEHRIQLKFLKKIDILGGIFWKMARYPVEPSETCLE